jgi:Domain of unknown function (DUF4331)
MTRNTVRVLAVAALALLAACDADAPATGPRAVAAATNASAATRAYRQIDRLGNPLVSEVMVVKHRHQLYNAGQPRTDVATWTGDITGFLTGTAGRDAGYAAAIAGALLPDMLQVYPKRDGTPVFWLSWVFGGYGGRSPSDDVVDIGLGALFGNLLGNNAGVTPGLTSDHVAANDVPFRATFPYLAAAH